MYIDPNVKTEGEEVDVPEESTEETTEETAGTEEEGTE
jgi:hypothetical protein